MFKSKRAALLFLTVVGPLVGGALLTGIHVGKIDGQQAAQVAAKVTDEREQRIMAHVLERNPNATIKDFSNFPRVLLEVSAEYGQDYRVIMAMIDKESGFDPKAIGKAGEIGLMQVMPDTAVKFAKAKNWTWYEAPVKRQGAPGYVTMGSLAEPKSNLIIGVAYFAERVQKFGDVPTALRAYNRGDAQAREFRPYDRYAEGIAFNFLALAAVLPR